MNSYIPESQTIRAKISVYTRVRNSDYLLSSSVCSISTEDPSAESVKNALRSRLKIEKTDPRFVKEILYYKGNRVNDSFEVKSRFFGSLEYELYLDSNIEIV